MSRFNKLFGGDPPGEPEWLREFARGGDPSVRKDEASWPYAGWVALNAGSGKNIQTSLGTQSAKAGAGGIQRGLVRGGITTAPPGPWERANKGGGCSCGGGEKCNSWSLGKASRSTPATTPSQLLSEVVTRPDGTSAALEELATAARNALAGDGIRVTRAEVAGMMKSALAAVRSHTKLSHGAPVQRRTHIRQEPRANRGGR